MLSLRRVLPCSLLLSIAWLAACGGQPPVPDAPPSQIPASPAGVFAITSRFDLEVPPAAMPVTAVLTAATDGADDPARFLIDRMIASLPEGTARSIASAAAPLLAALLDDQLDEIAPRLRSGIAALAAGLTRLAGHIGTSEILQIDASGAAVRTITGARFELGAAPITVSFADAGIADIAASTRVVLDAAGRVTLGVHGHRLPYGALLRLGLDRAVVAGVVPDARDLGAALVALVDCDRLGSAIADGLGVASPALYRTACRAGMIAIASELYRRIAAIDDTALSVELAGTASGVDLDGDGAMDELRAGSWAGTVSSASSHQPIQAATFAGHKTQ